MFNNNDIGIEYCIHGLNIKNGTNRNADWLGRHYFKKALAECDDWRIWCNLGTAYFYSEQFNQASMCYHTALSKEYSSIVAYNYAVSLIRNEDIVSAEETIQRLLSDESQNMIVENGGMTPSVLYAYCLFQLNQLGQCAEALLKAYSLTGGENLYDIFCLSVLCGAVNFSKTIASEVIKTWFPTKELLACLAECELVSNAGEIRSNIIQQDFESNVLLTFERFRDEEKRIKMIKKYKLIPPIIDYFYGIDDAGNTRYVK